MNRSIANALLLPTLLVFAGLLGCTDRPDAGGMIDIPDRPNILIITTDQQSARMMSAAGNEYVETPAMDRLASEGVRFERTYVTNPVCIPARFSLFTGRMPSAIGQRANQNNYLDPVPEKIRDEAMGWLLRDAGYETFYGGKVHFPKGMTAENAGFEVITENQRDTLAKTVSTFLNEDHEKPFALVASFINPHDICYMGIRDFASTDFDRALLRNGETELARLDRALQRPEGVSEEAFFDAYCPPLPPNFEPQEDEPEAVRELLKSRPFRWKARQQWSEERWREHRWAYARLTEMVDEQIGRVLEALEVSGRADDTVVIFTSDHGDHDSAHRMEHKTVPYEEAAAVPMIVRPPGGMQGRVDGRHLVSNGLDLIPTVCAYAGCDVPGDLDGYSLRPLVEASEAPNWRSHLVVESEIGPAIVSGRYKYLMCDEGANAEQLYDLQEDPHETRNFADDPDKRDVLERHRRLMEPVIAYWEKLPPIPE